MLMVIQVKYTPLKSLIEILIEEDLGGAILIMITPATVEMLGK